MSASLSRFRDDQPVSPGTKTANSSGYFENQNDASESRQGPLTAPFANHRQDLHVADSPNIPSISRDPPSAPLAQIAPWETENSRVPSTARLPPKNFFFDDDDDDDDDNAGPVSGYRPGTARTDTSESFDPPWRSSEDRQASFASSTTTTATKNSNETTGSRARTRKLVGKFVGDEDRKRHPLYSDRTPNASNSSLRPRASTTLPRKYERPVSPSSLRPRTPQAQLPSSDVAPWVFQDFEVSLVLLQFNFATFVRLYQCSQFKYCEYF